MRIAITGHSKGIGAGLYEKLAITHDVYGFSRSNGYDISKFSSQRRIIRESLQCDTFINNAWHDFHQVEMFERIYKEWQFDPTKTIVNINSKSRYGRFDGIPSIYSSSKKELAKKANCATMYDRECRIINVSPGLVDTDMIRDRKKDNPVLTVQEAADIIIWAVLQPQHVEIGELSFWAICDK